jgi:hypothetical protein
MRLFRHGKPLRGKPMCPGLDRNRFGQAWKFSLKGLMFLTFVVAVCSALVGASPVLAIIVVPLIAAALIRMIRVNQRIAGTTNDRTHRRGLFTSFCRSLALILCLLVVFTTASFAACVVGLLIALGAAARLCRPLVAIVRRYATIAWRVASSVWRSVRRRTHGVEVSHLFGLVRSHAVRGTALLIAACRVLIRHFWYPAIDDKATSSLSPSGR